MFVALNLVLKFLELVGEGLDDAELTSFIFFSGDDIFVEEISLSHLRINFFSIVINFFLFQIVLFGEFIKLGFDLDLSLFVIHFQNRGLGFLSFDDLQFLVFVIMVLLENIFLRIDEHELLLLLLKLFLLMLMGGLLLIAVSLAFMELFFLSTNSFFQSLDLTLLFSDGLFVVFVFFLMIFLLLLLFFDNFLLFFNIFSKRCGIVLKLFLLGLFIFCLLFSILDHSVNFIDVIAHRENFFFNFLRVFLKFTVVVLDNFDSLILLVFGLVELVVFGLQVFENLIFWNITSLLLFFSKIINLKFDYLNLLLDLIFFDVLILHIIHTLLDLGFHVIDFLNIIVSHSKGSSVVRSLFINLRNQLFTFLDELLFSII